ncbi:hypothetical protein [Halomonas sp. MS1]|nr:hypothetical protein [Halomonas sp. MS1]UTD54430.1 hypothetical protein NF683_14845 [Halomonas sp. MS1]
MTTILFAIVFSLTIVYAVVSSIYAVRLSRVIEGCDDWYAFLLNVQHHTMVGGPLKYDIGSEPVIPEYAVLKGVIRAFYFSFIPLTILAFLSHFLGW